MKKIISYLVLVIFSFSLLFVNCTINADYDGDVHGNNLGELIDSQTVNIFEKSVEEVRNNSSARSVLFSASVDDYIAKYDNSILEYQKVDAILLSDVYGFTDAQIEAIKNFDGTNETRARASQKYTTTTYLTSRAYNSSAKRTEVVVTYVLKTVGQNVSGGAQLQMVVGVDGSAAKFIRQNASTATAVYKNLANGVSQTKTIPLATQGSSASASKIEFSGMSKVSGANGFLQQATIKYIGYADGNVRNMAIMTAAALRGIVWNGLGISISTSGSASISISISYGWKEIDSFYKSYSYIN